MASGGDGGSRSTTCPCTSGASYLHCCGPLHEGEAAESPEALMRSRFAAYASARVDYVIATTDPGGPAASPDRRGWADEIERFCRETRFVGLSVLGSTLEGDEGTVTFRAVLEQGGRDASFVERSVFRRTGGRWYYHSGVVAPSSEDPFSAR